MPEENLLDGSGAPRRGDLKLSRFEMSVVSDDHSGLTDSQKSLLKFFESKTDGERFACRSDFEPTEIIKYLPYITIFDVEVNDVGEMKDIKVRLFGTALADFYGEWTGQWLKNSTHKDSLKQVHPETYNRIFAITKMILKVRKSITLYSHQVSDERSHWAIKILAIPFSKNGTDINMVFLYVELSNDYNNS